MWGWIRHRNALSASGFTFLELILVVGTSTILVGTAIPAVIGARQRFVLGGGTHDVAAVLQSARLQAVSSGRTLRVRFNCPEAGQYRVVEIVGDATIDAATNRCDAGVYPYPDQDSTARPNLDGPVRVLRGGARFGEVPDVDISPNGRITPVTGATPATITITSSNAIQTLMLSAAGRISFQ